MHSSKKPKTNTKPKTRLYIALDFFNWAVELNVQSSGLSGKLDSVLCCVICHGQSVDALERIAEMLKTPGKCLMPNPLTFLLLHCIFFHSDD